MKASVLKFIGFIVFIVILGIFAAGVFYVALIAFVLPSTKSEVVQHSIANADNTLIASVIRDDCGATCSCRIRVDLHMGDKILKEIFRNEESCDALIVWLDARHLEVQPDSGEKVVIDVNTLGLVK